MDYLAIIKSLDYAKVSQLFIEKKPSFDTVNEKQIVPHRSHSGIDYQSTAIKDYYVDTHDIFNTSIRPDKIIKKDSGEKDAAGNPTLVTTSVPVARIGIPIQKLIVERRVGFMLSDPVKTQAIYISESDNEKRLETMVERLQNDNKMDYRNKEIARRMMSELECAELWYFVMNDEPDQVLKGKFTSRVKILSPILGDMLYPLFDETGDMIAFARAYKLKEENKEIEHFDVYTSEFEYKYINKDNAWKLDDEIMSITAEGPKQINPIPNVVKKIMVIYHTQPRPEWADVQSMISRLEEITSNHADMNDYFGSPILTVAGDILGFAQKGEQGKILQLAQEAKASYLALQSSPESIATEQINLEKLIYCMSQTPDISFEQMIKIGGSISGIALKLMFIDAHMSVKNKEEIFGIGLQRRLNLIKAAIGAVIDTSLSNEAKTLQLKPVMTPFLPQNITEMIENLTVAKTGGIISTETAIEQNPLVEDAETEITRMQNDTTNQIAGTDDTQNQR